MKTGNNFADAKKKRCIKNEVTKFLDTHRDIKFSAAKFVYSIYSDQERSEKIIDFVNGQFVQTEKDLEMEKIITSTVSPDEFYDQGPALAVQELASWYLD
jgi:hypothetical protein